MQYFNQKLASLLCEGRKKKGLTQAELADRVGISFRTYQRIEAGEASPRLETALLILQSLDIDANEILLSFSPPSADPSPAPDSGAQLNWDSSARKHPLLLDPFTAEAIEAIKRTLVNEFEQGVSHLGYWDWNLATGEFHWSMQMYAIYEIEFDTPGIGHSLLDRLHPEDKAKVQAEINRLVQHNVPYDNTHRVIANGKTFLVRSMARKYVNSRNETIIFGITDRLPAEATQAKLPPSPGAVQADR